jgi:protein-L-isoaspartate(D-aspartate) O-methyltransferase
VTRIGVSVLAAATRDNLAAQGVENATVVLGDGTEGLPEHAPYDAIVVAAAHPHVPPPLVRQLALGGRLVQPIGPSGAEDVILFRRLPDGRLLRERSITRARFVPL